MRSIATVASAGRGRSLRAVSQGVLYQCALTLERCDDTQIPFVLRLADLGKALVLRSSLLTIEQELLFLAVTARWLTRQRATQQAFLVVSDYQTLSLRLSDGLRRDAFGAGIGADNVEELVIPV